MQGRRETIEEQKRRSERGARQQEREEVPMLRLGGLGTADRARSRNGDQAPGIPAIKPTHQRTTD